MYAFHLELGHKHTDVDYVRFAPGIPVKRPDCVPVYFQLSRQCRLITIVFRYRCNFRSYALTPSLSHGTHRVYGYSLPASSAVSHADRVTSQLTPVQIFQSAVTRICALQCYFCVRIYRPPHCMIYIAYRHFAPQTAAQDVTRQTENDRSPTTHHVNQAD